jgi:hypothetical protein
MAIVYQHITKSDKKVFYIGIGKESKRAFDFTRRSKFWKDFTKNHEFDVELLYENISYEEAKEIEIKLISKLGRRDLNKGFLVNQTNGGDGTLGKKMKHSEESKFKISLNNGMHQEEIKQKHKKSLNRPETKEKQRSAKLGVPRKRILCKKCNNEISDNNYTRHINIYCKKA